MLAGYQKWAYPQKSKYWSEKQKGFVGGIPAVPFGKWLPNSSWSISSLQKISLEQTLTLMRDHKPILLRFAHYGSWQSAMQSAGSKEDLERKGTCIQTPSITTAQRIFTFKIIVVDGEFVFEVISKLLL